MKKFFYNKLKSLFSILTCTMLVLVGISNVIAKPPIEKTPNDDWNTWAIEGDMISIPERR